MIWKPLKHPMIVDGYLISNNGYIRNKDCDDSDCLTADYHSSNGYDFIMLIVKEKYRINNSLFMLFPIDELLGITFIPIPTELKDKPITIKHINGDTRDIDLSNLEWIEDIEEWREIVFKNIIPNRYFVSSWGNIRSGDRLIKPFIDKDGYKRVQLTTVDKRQQHVAVHRITAITFVNNTIKDFTIVNHINGNVGNNYWKNLEWTDIIGNTHHAILVNLRKSGEDLCFSKLSNDQVEKICILLKQHNGSVIKVYNALKNEIPFLNRWIISVIKCKKCWKNISDKYFNYEDFHHIRRQYLSNEEVILICELLVEMNGSIKNVLYKLKEMNMSHITINHINKIKHKLVWKEISDRYFLCKDNVFIINK